MKINVIFTIVTKSYIPLANILGDSILKNQPETNFKVFVVDEQEIDKISALSKFDLISLEVLEITDFESVAFKYNLTEFCTAIKPKCFEYLFAQNYTNIIYLDPDVYVFSDFDSIYNNLKNYSICLTPHVLYPEMDYSGFWPQGAFLASGIYNLGFIALRASENTNKFLNWWSKNLQDSCYNDRSDGLFTDQKWIDFCPVFFPDMIILRELGLNVALWNIHERMISLIDGKYYINKRLEKDNVINNQLNFIHFSNFNFSKAESLEKFIPFTLERCTDFIPLVDFYRTKLIEYDFVSSNKRYKYKFNYFQNGISVNKFHRRLYRKLLENDFKFDNPFSIEKNSFYELLKKNRLIYKTELNIDYFDSNDDKSFSEKFGVIKFLSRLFIKFFGLKRYTFLCRFGLWFFKYENQIFLIHEFGNKIELKKTILYINTKDK